MAKRAATRRPAGYMGWRARRVREPGKLRTATDHGAPVSISPDGLAPPQRGGGWGPFAESFLHLNGKALAALEVTPIVSSERDGVVIRLAPGGRAGAIPLRSALNGQVVGGFVVRPRFGWAGVGRVLMETGWHASPEFLEEPLVPGSGREVPPWVLAGPILARLEALLQSMRRGYRQKDAILTQPRGRILWTEYVSNSLARGAWHQLPCRFPDLETDPLLRRQVRWALERVHRDLIAIAGNDPVALALARLASRLLEQLTDVVPLMPRRNELQRRLGFSRIESIAVRQGVEALSWIVDERGLGGGREQDGLAWVLPLERLWESFVEAHVRREAALIGGDVKVGRLRETTFPLLWSDPSHRSLGHLEPDIVVRRGRTIRVVDAKYKAHLAELDEQGWRRFTDEVRDSHRADVHQVLAYAALFDADEIVATLVYPLRHSTWRALEESRRTSSIAELYRGGRKLRLELLGLPFGSGRPELV